MNACGRCVRGFLFTLALMLAIGTVPGAEKEAPREKTTEQKIAFYRARLGGPATYPAYARLGLAYLEKFRKTGQTKFYEQGLRSLQQSLAYQRNFEALLGLAVGLAERHFFREALPYAEEAVAAMPSNLEAAGALFDIRLALGNVPEAQQILDGMLREQEGFHALSRLAALREYGGDISGAVQAMRKARDEAARGLPKPMVAWAETRLGSLHVALCNAGEAREGYARALSLDPGYFFANEHLVEWHAARGDWKEAEKIFRQLLKSHPQPLYRLGLAEAWRHLGKDREAKRETQTALAELEQSAAGGAQDPFRSLALLLLESDEGAAAGLRWAERDWEVRQDALAADTLAWAYHCNGNGPTALRLSEQALQSGSKNPGLLLHSGLIRCRWGREEDGRTLLKQALSCPLAFGPHERALAVKAGQASGG